LVSVYQKLLGFVPQPNLRVAFGYERIFTTYDIGAGVFRILDSTNILSPYYGTRIGYINRESNYESRHSSGSWGSESTSRGFSIAPVIGVKYSFYENISVGFEAEWSYVKLDNDGIDKSIGITPSSDITNGSQTSSGTNTKIIIRYFY
jgi:hypothetical protein